MQRLSGEESRYQTWLNHTISRTIVNKAKSDNAVIAIEDLAGIRDRTNQQPRNKTERRRSNSWAFYQLRMFLDYKAVQASLQLWLIVVIGERRGELSALHAYQSYRQRFDLEHCFRFKKQNLLLSAFETPDVEHEQQWVKFVMLAYVQLWAAHAIAVSLPLPWEKYL